MDSLPSVSQKLKLVCKACGGRHFYDVGTIYVWKPDENASADRNYGFSKYFRCRDCDGAGPWEIADYHKATALTLRASLSSGDKFVVAATPRLFDGTTAQAPALGEEHLLRLIEKDPENAFLCARLGNLLRACGRKTQAAAWYDKALTLDPGDIEARYHLFCFAEAERDDTAQLGHAQALVRHLLEGRKTLQDELTRGIAFSLVELLRQASPGVREELVRVSTAGAEPPETAFIRTLLAAKGNEDSIIDDATNRLVGGESAPASALLGDNAIDADDDDPSMDLIPALREWVEAQGLNPRSLTVVAEADDDGNMRVKDRRSIFLSDRTRTAVWEVGSLRELFRGDKAPPPDMDRYPPEYARCFFDIERHVLTACGPQGGPTDQEMEAIYSALRRLPDGKNHLGTLHAFLWQAAALTLATHRLSQAEFTAIIGQLERSVRKWAVRPVSRNYARYLRDQCV